MKTSENALFETFSRTLRSSLASQLSATGLLHLTHQSSNNDIYAAASRDSTLTLKDLAILRQLNDFSKKYIGKSNKDASRPKKTDRDMSAKQKFADANVLCGLQNQYVGDVGYDSDIEITLNIARGMIENAFWSVLDSEDSPMAWYGERLFPVGGFDTGTGTCSHASGNSFFEKYSRDWNFTHLEGIKYFRALRKMLKPLYDLPPELEVIMCGNVKASFVPKDLEVSRIVYPQLNGDIILQYPACAFLEKMLKYFNIDLSEQQFVNREMARIGSLYDNADIYDYSLKRRRPRYCTLDLKNASDIVGVELVRYLSPAPIFDYMMMCRPTNVIFPGDTVNTPLSMMALMGNAYCFPLQTLIFAALVRAVSLRCGLESKEFATYSVYGDDIIVDVTAYDQVIKTLKALKMVPNEKKSFSRGLFRESCGGDYFNGRNIRPVMFERLADDSYLYSVANRFIDWGLEHSVDVSLPVKVLLDMVSMKLVVPLDRGDTEGLRVSWDCMAVLPREWRANLTFSHRIDVILGENYKNDYTRITTTFFQRIAVVDRHSVVRSPYRLSTLPFLRGGIHQVMRRKKLLPVVETPSQRVRLRTSSLTVSVWDVPQDNCGLSGFWTSLVLRRNALARVWGVAPG